MKKKICTLLTLITVLVLSAFALAACQASDSGEDIDQPISVRFLTAVADGTANVSTTTAISLVFDKDIPELDVSHITLTGATKGVLSGTGPTRSLTVGDITVKEGETIEITVNAPAGYEIADGTKTVVIHKEAEARVPKYTGMTVSKTLAEKNSAAKTGRAAEPVAESDSEVVCVYTEDDEECYVYIHIDNPDSKEILSFTLNGYKFQSFQFKPGSNSRYIIVNYKEALNDQTLSEADRERYRLTPGYNVLTIDAMKYVEGTEIKDAIMAGDPTVTLYAYSREIVSGEFVPDDTRPEILMLPAAYLDRVFRVGLGGPATEQAPFTFTLKSGQMPSGLTLDKSGVISGTPAPEKYYVYQITVTATCGIDGSEQDYIFCFQFLKNPKITENLSNGYVEICVKSKDITDREDYDTSWEYSTDKVTWSPNDVEERPNGQIIEWRSKAFYDIPLNESFTVWARNKNDPKFILEKTIYNDSSIHWKYGGENYGTAYAESALDFSKDIGENPSHEHGAADRITHFTTYNKKIYADKLAISTDIELKGINGNDGYPKVGLFVRVESVTYYACLDLVLNNVLLVKLEGGTWYWDTPLIKESLPAGFDGNKANLALIKDGADFYISINGKTVGSATESKAEGRAYCGMMTMSYVTVFSNYTACDDTAEAYADILAAAKGQKNGVL